MFRQNIHQAVGLTPDQIEGAFFRLYYQFIKHAFGLMHRSPGNPSAKLRLYFDEFPETKEAASKFKGFILALKDNPQIHRAGWTNLILHGVDEPHLWHGNTLSGVPTYDELFKGAPQFFDCVLMNPPFGGKEGNRISDEDTRTPAALLDFIDGKGREAEAALARLRELIH